MMKPDLSGLVIRFSRIFLLSAAVFCAAALKAQEPRGFYMLSYKGEPDHSLNPVEICVMMAFLAPVMPANAKVAKVSEPASSSISVRKFTEELVPQAPEAPRWKLDLTVKLLGGVVFSADQWTQECEKTFAESLSDKKPTLVSVWLKINKYIITERRNFMDLKLVYVDEDAYYSSFERTFRVFFTERRIDVNMLTQINDEGENL